MSVGKLFMWGRELRKELELQTQFPPWFFTSKECQKLIALSFNNMILNITHYSNKRIFLNNFIFQSLKYDT